MKLSTTLVRVALSLADALGAGEALRIEFGLSAVQHLDNLKTSCSFESEGTTRAELEFSIACVQALLPKIFTHEGLEQHSLSTQILLQELSLYFSDLHHCWQLSSHWPEKVQPLFETTTTLLKNTSVACQKLQVALDIRELWLSTPLNEIKYYSQLQQAAQDLLSSLQQLDDLPADSLLHSIHQTLQETKTLFEHVFQTGGPIASHVETSVQSNSQFLETEAGLFHLQQEHATRMQRWTSTIDTVALLLEKRDQPGLSAHISILKTSFSTVVSAGKELYRLTYLPGLGLGAAILSGLSTGALFGPIGALVGVGISLVAHFSGGKRIEPHTFIAQQIQALSGMVVTLSEYIEQRSNRLELRQDQLYQAVLEGFKTLKTDISKLHSLSQSIQIKLNQLQHTMELGFTESALSTFSRHRGTALSVNQLSPSDVKKYLLSFRHTGTHEASNSTLSGELSPHIECSVLLTKIARQGLSHNINCLVSFLHSSSDFRHSTPLVNPTVWGEAVDAFLRLAYRYPAISIGSDIQRAFEQLQQAGIEFQKFQRQLRTSTVIFHQLFADYRTALNALILKIDETVWAEPSHAQSLHQFLFEHHRGLHQNLLPQNTPYPNESVNTQSAESTEPTCFCLLPDERFAVGAADNTIVVWTLNPFQREKTLVGHTQPVRALDKLPNGRLVSVSEDKLIKIWNIASGNCEITLRGHTWPIQNLCVLSASRIATNAKGDNLVRIWNLENQTCEKEIKKTFSHPIGHLAIFKGDFLLSSHFNATDLRFWNVTTGEIDQVLKNPGQLWHLQEQRSSRGSGGGRVKVDYTDDISTLCIISERFFLAGYASGNIGLWDRIKQREIRFRGYASSLSSKNSIYEKYICPVQDIKILQDHRFLTISKDHVPRIWRIVRLESDLTPLSFEAANESPTTFLICEHIFDFKSTYILSLQPLRFLNFENNQISLRETQLPPLQELKIAQKFLLQEIQNVVSHKSEIPLEVWEKYQQQHEAQCQNFNSLVSTNLSERLDGEILQLENRQKILSAYLELAFHAEFIQDGCLQEYRQSLLPDIKNTTSPWIYLKLKKMLEISSIFERHITDLITQSASIQHCGWPTVDRALEALRIFQAALYPNVSPSRETALPLFQNFMRKEHTYPEECSLS